MSLTQQNIRLSLLAKDSEFRSLAEEHSRCESQLEEILGSQYVNVEALIQEITLKKQKLRLKDQMELIVARHQQTASH